MRSLERYPENLYTNPTSITVTPNGKHLLAGSWLGIIKVWDFKTGRLVGLLRGHKSWEEKALELIKRRPVHIHDSAVEHEWILSSITVTPDGKHVISGADDKTVKIWDLKTGRLKHSFEGHTDTVIAIAVTPDGRKIVSGSFDRKIIVWDLKTQQLVRSLDGHTDTIRSIAVTPKGEYIVSGSDDNTVKVWELTTGQLTNTLEGHTNSVRSVSSDFRQYACCLRILGRENQALGSGDRAFP